MCLCIYVCVYLCLCVFVHLCLCVEHWSAAGPTGNKCWGAAINGQQGPANGFYWQNNLLTISLQKRCELPIDRTNKKKLHTAKPFRVGKSTIEMIPKRFDAKPTKPNALSAKFEDRSKAFRAWRSISVISVKPTLVLVLVKLTHK